MNTLQHFLGTNKITNLTKEVPLSTRIANSEGEPYNFTIQTLKPEAVSAIQKKCTKPQGGNGEYYFDKSAFDIALVIAGTTNPNFKSAEHIQALGLNTPEQYVESVLLAGEIQRLSTLIQDFNGYLTTIDSLITQAKN